MLAGEIAVSILVEVAGFVAVLVHAVVPGLCSIGVHLGGLRLLPVCRDDKELGRRAVRVIPAVWTSYLPRVEAVPVFVSVVAVAVLVDAVVPDLLSPRIGTGVEIIAVSLRGQESIAVKIGSLPAHAGGDARDAEE